MAGRRSAVDLTGALLRAGAARPHVLTVTMPGGTAGYHLTFLSAASGKLFANCALSFASISWSAPFAAVKLPTSAMPTLP